MNIPKVGWKSKIFSVFVEFLNAPVVALMTLHHFFWKIGLSIPTSQGQR